MRWFKKKSVTPMRRVTVRDKVRIPDDLSRLDLPVFLQGVSFALEAVSNELWLLAVDETLDTEARVRVLNLRARLR